MQVKVESLVMINLPILKTGRGTSAWLAATHHVSRAGVYSRRQSDKRVWLTKTA
jgi:hypothetical protein